MIQDAVMAGLLPKHHLETRLASVIETATSTYLQALDGEDRATAKLYDSASEAADEAWQQTVDGHNGPSLRTRQCQRSNTAARLLKTTTVTIWIFSSTPRESPLGAPQLQAQLSRLFNRTGLRRRKNTSPRERGSKWRGSKTCATRMSPTSGSVLTRHDFITDLQKRLGIGGTPVGPGKDTHGTLGPGQRGGRGWPDINDTNVKSRCNDASLKHSKTPVFRQTENVDTLYFEEQVRWLDDLCKAKEEANYRFTTPVIRRQQC